METLSICQFHSYADLNHYMLCYSCVHHIKPFKALLVNYESPPCSHSLSFCVCLFLYRSISCSLCSLSASNHDHSCLYKKIYKKINKKHKLSRKKWLCLLKVWLYMMSSCKCIRILAATSMHVHHKADLIWNRLCKHSSADSVRRGCARYTWLTEHNINCHIQYI